MVPVVAGCGCSWWSVSGTRAASCSAGVRMPMAQWGRTVLYQWTHWAVAGPGGVDALPGAVLIEAGTVADELGLVQRVEGPGQSKAERSPLRPDGCDRLALGQGLPVPRMKPHGRCTASA